MKIRTRLTAAVLVCLLPILIGFGIITAVARASDRAKTLALIEEYTGSIATSLEAFFDEAAELAVYLAALQGELEVEWAEGGSRIFTTLVSNNASVKEAGRVDENGDTYLTNVPGNPWKGGRVTVNDADPDAVAVNLVGSEYWITYIEGNRGDPAAFVVEPYVPDGMDYKAIVTGAPVMRAGRCVGAVNIFQSSQELSSLYADITKRFMDRFGTEAQSYLISDGGQLVSSVKYSAEARGYRDSLWGTNDIVSSDTLGREALSVFDSALKSGQSVVTANLAGVSCFVSSTRIENTPFILCFAVRAGYMLSSTRTILLTSFVVFAIIVLLLFVILRVATNVMLSSLKTMNGAMQEIAAGGGDLTARIDVRGNDEIAEIGTSFNEFISSLHGMILSVSESSSSMQKIVQTLSGNVQEISGDVSEIHKDIGDMNFAVEEQSASVTETSSTITQIAKNIENLTAKIEDQSASVTQVSAAVQEMVANIGSISANISKAAGSFDELKSNAGDGKGSINHVQDLVNKLSLQSDSLLEANNVIDNIASQTNLLAMNAAIEAAHAGESGKGFSVVAEEIRKLAEDSSEQSKTIAAGLKTTISSIKSIADATSVADSAFDSVTAQISSLTQLVSSIDIAMHEQNEGSRQVLDGLRDIENVTTNIRDGAVEMNNGTDVILKEITRLSSVSQHVQDSSASIATAADAINGAVEGIVQYSNSSSEAIDVLVGITGKFVL